MVQKSIDPAVLAVLKDCRCEGTHLYLPERTLDRTLYTRVNEVLTRLGGKWKGGKTRAHIFPQPAQPLLEQVLGSLQMPAKNPTDYYPTPERVITIMLAEGFPPETRRILEPSAGTGHIARALRAHFSDSDSEERGEEIILDCCEIVPAFRDDLIGQGFSVVAEDFLAYRPRESYDAVVMNPPFTREGDPLAYITHIQHAFALLRPGGKLIALAPAGFTFRTERRIVQLRDQVKHSGFWHDLPPGSFTESGTEVNIVLLTMRKPPILF